MVIVCDGENVSHGNVCGEENVSYGNICDGDKMYNTVM
jgi:hypothetical protein